MVATVVLGATGEIRAGSNPVARTKSTHSQQALLPNWGWVPLVLICSIISVNFTGKSFFQRHQLPLHGLLICWAISAIIAIINQFLAELMNDIICVPYILIRAAHYHPALNRSGIAFLKIIKFSHVSNPT